MSAIRRGGNFLDLAISVEMSALVTPVFFMASHGVFVVMTALVIFLSFDKKSRLRTSHCGYLSLDCAPPKLSA